MHCVLENARFISHCPSPFQLAKMCTTHGKHIAWWLGCRTHECRIVVSIPGHCGLKCFWVKHFISPCFCPFIHRNEFGLKRDGLMGSVKFFLLLLSKMGCSTLTTLKELRNLSKRYFKAQLNESSWRKRERMAAIQVETHPKSCSCCCRLFVTVSTAVATGADCARWFATSYLLWTRWTVERTINIIWTTSTVAVLFLAFTSL